MSAEPGKPGAMDAGRARGQRPARPVVELDHVTRILTDEPQPVTLVRDITLRVDEGEFMAITGPSGSGKSSLIYLIGLLDSPTSGRIILDGIDTSRADKARKERLRLTRIGFVFQFHFLLPEFTALENVLLPMRKLGALSDRAMLARGLDLLGQFGLSDAAAKKPHQLSGGERQRVAIARALANDPLLLVADEPTGNLDSKNSELVFSLFDRLAREAGKTVISVTHDPEMARMTHRQIRILDGALVADSG